MKRFLGILILLGLILFLVPPVKAAVIFLDPFQGGYNLSQWTVIPGEHAPVQSQFLNNFGITADPQYPGDYSGLFHVQNIPGESIIKFEMKINGSIVSDFGIFLRDATLGSNWKSAYLFGTYGYGGVPNIFLLRESNVGWNQTGTWDESVGIHSFEVIFSDINNSISLKEDGITLGSWISNYNFPINEVDFGIFGSYSEFANFQLCDADGCTAPTPPPTPPPTPSPTPPMKVVVIPGFGGSWNPDAIIQCKKDSTEPWTSYAASDYVYGNLLSSIQNSGFAAPEPFYYDWRKDINTTKLILKDFINATVSGTEKVDIVGHSMGGLVGRAYIEQEGRSNKADKYLSVGTPHKGLLSAYAAWAGGKIEGNIFWKMGAATAIHFCWKKHPEMTDRKVIQEFFPSVQNMLPIFDYLKDAKTGTRIPFRTMHDINKNNFLDPNNPPLFINTLYGTLSGYGTDTPEFYDVTSPNKQEIQLGDWLDGKPKTKEYSMWGDGAVLNTSSMFNSGAANAQLPLNHTDLVRDQMGIGAILQFLTTGSIPLALTQRISPKPEPSSALVIIGYPANFSVTVDGNMQKDKRGIVAFINPKAGSYHLHLLPTSPNTQITIGQFLPNDQILWKEYQWNSKSPKDGTINFNPANPIEDALK